MGRLDLDEETRGSSCKRVYLGNSGAYCGQIMYLTSEGQFGGIVCFLSVFEPRDLGIRGGLSHARCWEVVRL